VPVILREAGLRYYFFSNEGSPREPAHVHVSGGGRDAKVWLEPEIRLRTASASVPLKSGVSYWTVSAHRRRMLKAWYEHLSNLG
jgi:hypothetical protein